MKTFGIRTAIKNRIYKPNKDALFIFGFAKSGTSAIAGLLAAKSGKSVTIDTHYLWEPYKSKLITGEISLKEHVEKFSYPFSKNIIKEPNATFLIKEIKEYFSLNPYIYIVRNPFDNIRSILNRLRLPGDQDHVDLNLVNKNWQNLFKETEGKEYIKTLAKKWLEVYSQTEYLESEACVLTRYEDFNIDKEPFIDKLSERVGFQSQNSISHLVNRPFQPKGNSSIDLETFYSPKNYNIILEICGEKMNSFGY